MDQNHNQLVARHATLLDIPHAIILENMYPHLPASLIYGLARFGGHWEDAFRNLMELPGPTRLIQPILGAQVVTRYLLQTPELTRRVHRGRLVTPAFNRTFPNRRPRLIASRSGIMLVFLRDPDELVLWNPVENDQVQVEYSHLIPVANNLDQLDMIVETIDGVARASRIVIVLPFVFFQSPGGAADIHFWHWSSLTRQWFDQDEDMHVDIVENFTAKPGAVVIGSTIFYQWSERVIGWFQVLPDNEVAGSFHMPDMEVDDSLICEYHGRLGLMTPDVNQVGVTVFTRQENAWVLEPPILLGPIIFKFRHIFGSRSMGTRRKPAEQPVISVNLMTLVSYFENSLVIYLRQKWVLIDLQTMIARNLPLGRLPDPPFIAQMMRFFPYKTTMLLLPLSPFDQLLADEEADEELADEGADVEADEEPAAVADVPPADGDDN